MGSGITSPPENPNPDRSPFRAPHKLIEARATLAPSAIAVSVGASSLSYRELNARANRLAHYLRHLGAQPGALVGVHLDRSFDTLASLLAILKLGAIYLPLDPKFPRERLEFMAEDARVSFVLAHSARRKTVPRSKSQVILLDELSDVIAQAPDDNPASAGDPAATAYVIYTSGSTGRPKGVMVSAGALTNFLLAMAERPGMAADDVLLSVSPSSFDISLLEFLLPLVCGGQVVLATAQEAADGRELDRLLRLHPVTVMQATPATWRMMLESGWTGKPDLRVLCGGEALSRDLARHLLPLCRELWNMYGPTEATIWSSVDRVTSANAISLGAPIRNMQYFVLDENRAPVPAGTPGELWIGGTGLAKGYLHRPELTAERFVADSGFASLIAEARLYRTGDEVRFRADGSLEFLGRLDHQIKLNGFRIELGEIEYALANIDGVRQAVVLLREDRPGDKRLVAYYTGRSGLSSSALIEALQATLPDYMIPAAFLRIERFPLTPSGKVDRKALPRPATNRPVLTQDFVAPRTKPEKQLAALWRELLQIDEIGIDDSFFDLGGKSLDVVRMVRECQARFGREIPAVKVFQHPTIARLAAFLDAGEREADFLVEAEGRSSRARRSAGGPEAVAIVGMSGRFPGASNPDELWRNLLNSVESISTFKPEELGPGIDESLRNDPSYVRARGLIEDADLFDAAFFGIGPLEARIMDPQQRVFLELAWHALENAGCDPERFRGRIGVFAGIGDNRYYPINLLSRPDLLSMAGRLAVEYGNEKDYIALRAAYLLDLRGPAISMNTACSTTLLAVDRACRSLLDRECDLALAGGVDIAVPQKSGFLYQEGGTFTRDGHCRPFDADATGTMFSDGAGIVALKRLSDAIAAGDTIYAVILGSGVNNNGARPASFLAPSMEGQAEAIALAQAEAAVPVESIRYIEAHGTATPLGDPIEFEALRKVFERKTAKKQFCFLGSIKGNIGHPTNAAGVVGLIKAAMVLDREQIPPTLHFKRPNPAIDFASSPFVMADKLTPFPRGGEVRRAAVSSFGFGGTNVHTILEEAPLPAPSDPSRPRQLILLSAKSEKSLAASTAAFADYFSSSAPEAFADAAYTLQTGRRSMPWRRFLVAADPAGSSRLLLHPHPLRSGTRRCDRRNPPVVFLFGGQGTQYVNMGLNLYRDEPLFRAVVDDCCEQLKPHLGHDLRTLLFPAPGDETTAQISLQNTLFTQPSIFVIEYALARFWQSLGVEPAMMAGHSIGEFVAATLAGVWNLEDVLAIVALRGRLMQSLPRGSMMAVNAGAEAVSRLLPSTIQIASKNAPGLCVVSGPGISIEELRQQLEAQNIVCRSLHTSHAFHSAMMDPIVEPLHEAIGNITLRKPERPFVSSVKGRLIADAEATDPAYWAGHARATVEFGKALLFLKKQGFDLFLECGPRSTMCSLARHQFTPERPCLAIPTLADTAEDNTEWRTFLFALGTLWQNGVSISWDAFYTNERRRHIPLPGYAFDRQRFWVDPAATMTAQPPVPLDTSTPVFDAPQTSVTIAHSEPVSRKHRIHARLAELLTAVSGLESSQLDSAAQFMEQGFDSLSLTQVALAIRREFSVKITFSQLMNQFPSLDLLVDHLDGCLNTASPDAPCAAPVPAANAASTEAPSTIPQRGIFASSCLSNNLSVSYNESVTIRITGVIAPGKIERVLARLIDRHDALRAHFDESGHTMTVASNLALDLPVVDLSGESPDRIETRLRQLTADEVALPFQLPSGPLFRAKLVVLAPDRAALILTAHHVLCDGWSLDVLIHDFCAFYSEELSGTPVALKPTGSFLDYCRSVRAREQSHDFAQARAFWRTKFAEGFPALLLPADHPRTKRREFAARRIDCSISAPVVESLRALAARHGSSFFAALLSSLAILFARISRQRRFVLALPIAEQPAAGQPGLVGHCVNLVPFEVSLHEGESVAALLKRVQSDLAAAQDYNICTMISLLGDLRPPADSPAASPISAGFTNITRFKPGELAQSGFTVDYAFNPKPAESFELYMSAVESESALDFHCHYDVKLFDDLTIREWLAALASILESIAADPAQDAFVLAEHPSAPAILYALAPPVDSPEDFVSAGPAAASLTEPQLLEALLPLWRRVLGLGAVAPDDDFFSLGGNSVAAAQLFALIQRETGYSAPLSVLYDASTPRLLAGVLLRGAAAQDWNPLVPIRRDGTRTPLFLVHAAEGNILLYRSLAEHLGDDQPVYGLQSAGLDGHTPVDARFEHVSARYIEELRTVQPHGPYMLGGYCLGGTIALEMAHQLIAAGETVAFLGLIEDYNIRAMTWPLGWRDRAMNRVLNPWYHLQNALDAPGAAKVAFFMDKFHVEMRRFNASLRGAWTGLRYRLSPSIAPAAPRARLSDIYDRAHEQYEIRPYPGELTLFFSERHLAGFNVPLGGWNGVAEGGTRLYTFPFNPRGSLIEPYVRQLAEAMRASLDRVQEIPRSTSRPSLVEQ